MTIFTERGEKTASFMSRVRVFDGEEKKKRLLPRWIRRVAVCRNRWFFVAWVMVDYVRGSEKFPIRLP